MPKRYLIIVMIVATLITAGCGSSSPDAVTDGDYQTFATSDQGTTPPGATLTISGTNAAFTTDGTTVTAAIGDPGSEYLLCPPDTKGAVRPMDATITLGTLTITRPAIFGDCGVTSPSRVTIVDLDSVNTASATLPFDRWIEMCNQADPDC